MKGLFQYKGRKTFFLTLIKNHRFKYIFIFLLIIFFEFLSSSFTGREIESKTKYIFSFWESRYSLPGYIKLCIKTWKKFLANNYKIIILDYNNLSKYLDKKIINKILLKHMALSFQADAIRVAILRKFGGIWMDCDTIITNSECMNMFNGSDLLMFGISKKKHPHIGFIYSSNNSTILKYWLDGIFKRIRIYKIKLLLKHIFPIKCFIKSFEKLLTWDYLGNGILNEIIKNTSEKDFKMIKREDAYIFPELFFFKGTESKSYKDFYFTSGDPLPVLKKCKGVLILHNSWTPEIYKKMSEEEFLSQDIMLSRLFSILLNNDSKVQFGY